MTFSYLRKTFLISFLCSGLLSFSGTIAIATGCCCFGSDDDKKEPFLQNQTPGTPLRTPVETRNTMGDHPPQQLQTLPGSPSPHLAAAAPEPAPAPIFLQRPPSPASGATLPVVSDPIPVPAPASARGLLDQTGGGEEATVGDSTGIQRKASQIQRLRQEFTDLEKSYPQFLSPEFYSHTDELARRILNSSLSFDPITFPNNVIAGVTNDINSIPLKDIKKQCLGYPDKWQKERSLTTLASTATKHLPQVADGGGDPHQAGGGARAATYYAFRTIYWSLLNLEGKDPQIQATEIKTPTTEELGQALPRAQRSKADFFIRVDSKNIFHFVIQPEGRVIYLRAPAVPGMGTRSRAASVVSTRSLPSIVGDQGGEGE